MRRGVQGEEEGKGMNIEMERGVRGEWCSILNKVSCEVTGEWVEVWREEDKSREKERAWVREGCFDSETPAVCGEIRLRVQYEDLKMSFSFT